MDDSSPEQARPKPASHVDLGKEHKKLLHYYEDISEQPVDETRFFRTYLAKHKESGEWRSVRIVPKKKLPKESFVRQVSDYQQLYHPNVVHLYETLEDKKYYYFVSDRVDRPNIYQVLPQLYSNPQDFDEAQVALLVRTILRALRYCHKKGFPHTDLTYHNLLVDPDRGLLKGVYIVGFGYAKLRQKDGTYHHKNSILQRQLAKEDSTDSEEEEEDPSTIHIQVAPEDLFAAPETRAGDLSIFEEPADIWSMGIITFQLLTRHHPYEDPDVRPRKFEDKAWKEDFFRNHPFLENISAVGRDFLKQMLTFKDFERPTAAQAYEHDWLKRVDHIGSRARKEALLDSLDNLTSFDAQNKLEQVARMFIANHLLYQPEKHSLQSIFRHLDRNHDKVITKDELATALEKAHGEDKQVKILELLESTFEQVDVDGNGQIDYLEFLSAAANESLLFTKKNLRLTFDALDKSNTGTITKADIKELCDGEMEKKLISRKDIRRLLREADANGDGEIDFEEFCDMMRRTQ